MACLLSRARVGAAFACPAHRRADLHLRSQGDVGALQACVYPPWLGYGITQVAILRCGDTSKRKCGAAFCVWVLSWAIHVFFYDFLMTWSPIYHVWRICIQPFTKIISYACYRMLGSLSRFGKGFLARRPIVIYEHNRRAKHRLQ